MLSLAVFHSQDCYTSQEAILLRYREYGPAHGLCHSCHLTESYQAEPCESTFPAEEGGLSVRVLVIERALYILVLAETSQYNVSSGSTLEVCPFCIDMVASNADRTTPLATAVFYSREQTSKEGIDIATTSASSSAKSKPTMISNFTESKVFSADDSTLELGRSAM